jgi:hypothetical protein
LAGVPPKQLPKTDRKTTDLIIESGVLGDDAVRGLIDDWLVPGLVDQILGDLKPAFDPAKG